MIPPLPSYDYMYRGHELAMDKMGLTYGMDKMAMAYAGQETRNPLAGLGFGNPYSLGANPLGRGYPPTFNSYLDGLYGQERALDLDMTLNHSLGLAQNVMNDNYPQRAQQWANSFRSLDTYI